jgi:NAD+ synthetase
VKFALAQINPLIGDIAGNTEKIRKNIRRASDSGADLVVFPELAITGYSPQDLLDFPAFVQKNEEALHSLAAETGRTAALVGFVAKNSLPTGKPLFNAAALLQEGKLKSIYNKQLLPNYDIFDEDRYFSAGKQPFVFELKGQRLAVTICEDLWAFEGFLGHSYAVQPLLAVREARCDWVVNLSASPFHLGKPEVRKKLFEKVVQFTGAGLVYCNQVGAQDDLVFDGGSCIVDKNGKLQHQAPYFKESLLTQDSPSPSEAHSSAEWLVHALCLGIRDYVEKTKGKGVCLGLSGGIDSSVVAALAVRALGSDRVQGVLLPTQFTSSASTEDAEILARNLKIAALTLPVQSLYQEAGNVLTTGLQKPLASLSLENLQPRLRMVLLMAVSNERGLLLLNTSNKSELAAGYATLYGDSAGALAVLGDLTKDQVYAVAEFLNSQGAGIPQRVLDRAPSAELREGQKDEDSLPPYSVLDPMVRSAVEGPADGPTLEAQGFPKEAVEKFLSLYRVSEFKRRQFPPILRVSSRAFGRGRRIPVASFKSW